MFRIGLDIFNIYLFIVSKRFWNKNIIFNIYGLPLTWKAQVGGSTWAKGAHEGEAPWGSFLEASPLPPWRNPREGNPRAQPLGLPPPPREPPLPSPYK